MKDTHNNTHNQDEKIKYITEGQQCIVFPTLDLSTKRIGLGNGSNRVTPVAYDIKFHPATFILFKSLLIKASILDSIPLSDSNIHFISYGLIQSTDETTVNN